MPDQLLYLLEFGMRKASVHFGIDYDGGVDAFLPPIPNSFPAERMRSI